MFTKENLEKVVFESLEDIKLYEGKDISDKHIIIKEKLDPVKLGNLKNCFVEGTNVICTKLINCQVENLANVYADEIESCIFKYCYKIQCGDYDEEFTLKDCQFLNCIKVIVSYSRIENCKFNKIHTLYLTCTDMTDCEISDVICEDDCVISMEDGNISKCVFDNLDLRNDSYIVNGYGSPFIEECTFKNIKSSLDYDELFNCEETVGFVSKKIKKYCIHDEATCIFE